MQNDTQTLMLPKPKMKQQAVNEFSKSNDELMDLLRYKIYLVAKGYHQREGKNFGNTFSLLIKPLTIRLLLSMAISLNWAIHQLDVKNIFLYIIFEEDVYMIQPPNFKYLLYPNHVYHLKMSLYEFKQAPRVWFFRLSSKLIELDFQDSKSRTSLFIYKQGLSHVYILIYVNDILITHPNTTLLAQMVCNLQTTLHLKIAIS